MGRLTAPPGHDRWARRAGARHWKARQALGGVNRRAASGNAKTWADSVVAFGAARLTNLRLQRGFRLATRNMTCWRPTRGGWAWAERPVKFRQVKVVEVHWRVRNSYEHHRNQNLMAFLRDLFPKWNQSAGWRVIIGYWPVLDTLIRVCKVGWLFTPENYAIVCISSKFQERNWLTMHDGVM